MRKPPPMKAFLDDLETRITKLEETHGWDRRRGWDQVVQKMRASRSLNQSDLRLMYEFGRFAQMSDLLEELS